MLSVACEVPGAAIVNDLVPGKAVRSGQRQRTAAEGHAACAADGAIKAAVAICDGQILAAQRDRAIPRQITHRRALISAGDVERAVGNDVTGTCDADRKSVV